MKPENLVHLRVWGDFACFTRPEMKVERVSYPIITPSAARGVLEAVFWKPQMYYLIHQITVLRHTVGGREYGKGKWVSFRRNEVTQTMKTSVAQKWMNSPESFAPFQAGGGAADATQRNTLALADVAYLISESRILVAVAISSALPRTRLLFRPTDLRWAKTAPYRKQPPPTMHLH